MEREEGPKEKTFGGESVLRKAVERLPLMSADHIAPISDQLPPRSWNCRRAWYSSSVSTQFLTMQNHERILVKFLFSSEYNYQQIRLHSIVYITQVTAVYETEFEVHYMRMRWWVYMYICHQFHISCAALRFWSINMLSLVLFLSLRVYSFRRCFFWTFYFDTTWWVNP